MTRILNTLAAIALSIVSVPGAAQSAAPTDDVTAIATVLATEWLGAGHGGPATAAPPVWQGRGAMTFEAQAATRVIRGWWPAQLPDDRARAIIDGFATYLQTFATEQAFDRRYLRQAHSVESQPYFGGHVIWSFPPLRLSRQAVAGRDRQAAVFVALEKWIGLPALRACMFAVADLPPDRLSGAAIVNTISQTAGQDVAWLFAAGEDDLNYSVASVVSAIIDECRIDCHDTVVTVTRAGAGSFPGRAEPRVGEFDSGDALELRVEFRDGPATSVRWDGRDRARSFRFRGPSPATAAYLDPVRQFTFDGNLLDNAVVPPARTNVPVRKWSARWLVWLQHAMLSYGYLS